MAFVNREAGAPLFSVVVPTLNAGKTLTETLASLARQSCRDFEVALIDGASTDDTIAIAESFRGRLPGLRILSGPDDGVYDAINKGVLLSRGDWVYVLGSDDRLVGPDILATVAAELDGSTEDLVYGDVRMGAPNPWVPVGARYAGRMDFVSLLDRNICQQAIFYRRSVFDRLGLFKPEYRVCADWDFAYRAFATVGCRWLDLVICEYAATGMSATTVDHRFCADRPLRLARLALRHPFSHRFTHARFILRKGCKTCLSAAQPFRAMTLCAAYAMLAMHARLRRRVRPST